MARSRRRDDDDYDDDDTPRRKSSRRRDDDEDDDEETPQRKSRSIADDDDEDDDRPRKASRRRDEDDDDRPRRPRKRLKRSKKSSGGGGALLLVLGLLGGFVLLAGGGAAVWYFTALDTPEKAFEDVKAAALKKDYGRYYDRWDKEGQNNIDRVTEGLVNVDPTLAVHRGKRGRELYVAVSQEIAKRPETDFVRKLNEGALDEVRDAKVERVVVDGDTATLTIRTGSGKESTPKMVKQDGKWRMKTGGFR